MKPYSYVGPAAIRDTARFDTPRHEVLDMDGLRSWLSRHAGFRNQDREITCTYVVQPPGKLFVADRHSEHVACARGEPVLTAGEITFERDARGLAVTEASNLSIGYCPEPGSWVHLGKALLAAGFPPLDGFTQPFEFRWCAACRQTCVIKDDVFECPSCGDDLPRDWNYDHR